MATNQQPQEGLWAAGAAVRLINDPGREGTLTGRSMDRAGTRFYQVRFPGVATSWQPEYELEPVPEEQDLYALLEAGQFGRAGDLRRGLTHITLSGRMANVVYSMRTTNTKFLPYQYKPVLAMLDSPSNGLLVADEVGLGKTIEAGLLWTELRARFDARRLLVVCPAMLRVKWKRELALRFGVQAEIVDAAQLLEELKLPKEQTREGRALICSLQGIRPPKDYEDRPTEGARPTTKLAKWLAEQADLDPVVDLLVIDEAHYLRNPDTQTNEVGHLLRPVSEYVVLLSATPVNLHSVDLHSLLRLVDPDSFQNAWVFDQVLRANEPLIAARREALRPGPQLDVIQEHLRRALTDPLLQTSRVLQDLAERIEPAVLRDPAARVKLAETIERINPLARVISRTRKVEVEDERVIRDPHLEGVTMTAAEETFYWEVTQAIRKYALLNGVGDGFLLAMPQRMVSSCMAAAAQSFTGRTLSREDIETINELEYEALGVEEGIDEPPAAGPSGRVRAQEERPVGPLIAFIRASLAHKVNLAQLTRDDSKYRRLVEVLRRFLEQHPDQKVVVFSYFKPTLAYLEKRLESDGIRAARVVGGMDIDKQEVIDAFRDDPRIRVLLSSEVASEGVDLQFCRVLVNYDLPWNPMKVEQRIGRIDRIGQQARMIGIWNLYHNDTIDERIVARLYMRLRIFEQALGGLDAVLGEEIARLTADLLSRELTADEEARVIEQRALAIEQRKNEEERLEQEASGLVAHGGAILDAIRAADELDRRVTDQDLFTYVRDYLETHAQDHVLRQVGDNPIEVIIRLAASTAASLGAFIQHRRAEGGTRLSQGVEVRCRFQNLISARDAGVEIISQFHPLIRFITDELNESGHGCFPLVAVLVRQSVGGAQRLQRGTFAFTLSHWSFVGVKTEEDLHVRAVRLRDGEDLSSGESFDLLNTARLHGMDWPEAAGELATAEVRSAIDTALLLGVADFEAERTLKQNENHDRAAFQIASLERHLQRKRTRHLDLRDSHIAAGRKGLARAEERKLRTLEEAFETKREGLQRKVRLDSTRFEVCAGVIRVE